MFLLLSACVPSGSFDSPTGTVEVSHVAATVDGDIPTSVRVSARLSTAAALDVRCVADDDPDEAHRATTEASTEPAVTLHGLLPATDYTCDVGPVGGAPASSAAVTTGEFGDVPDFAAEGGEGMEGAYTLFNAGPTCDTLTPQQVWIVDPEGRPRWGYTLPEAATGDVDASWLGGNEVQLGGGSGSPGRGDGIVRVLTLAGDVRYDRTEPVEGSDYTHQATRLADGQVLSLVWERVSVDDVAFWGFRIERLAAESGALAWAWSSADAVAAGDLPVGEANTDAFHANAAVWFPDDPEGESYWVSLAEKGWIIRIDAATGRVTWRLGLDGDFALVDAAGAAVTEPDGWWEFQHAISMRVEGDGVRLSMEDNGYTRGWSRLLDLDVDGPGRVARVAWEWTEPGWVERNGGDHDVLPGGHRLATQGHCACCSDSGDRESTVTEVDPTDGRVVWRLTVPGDSEYLYRSERLDGCALFANERYCPAE